MNINPEEPELGTEPKQSTFKRLALIKGSHPPPFWMFLAALAALYLTLVTDSLSATFEILTKRMTLDT